MRDQLIAELRATDVYVQDGKERRKLNFNEAQRIVDYILRTYGVTPR